MLVVAGSVQFCGDLRADFSSSLIKTELVDRIRRGKMLLLNGRVASLTTEEQIIRRYHNTVDTSDRNQSTANSQPV